MKKIYFLFASLLSCVCSITTISTKNTQVISRNQKKLNILVYFAGNNDLYEICIQQLKQMALVGSQPNVNIIAQLDVYKQPASKRFIIHPGNVVELETIQGSRQAISGTPESLIGFVEWGMESFPAESLYLIISNHGDGIKDKEHWHKILPSHKGIAINDHAQCYLTNQELEYALRVISHNILSGRKIPLVLTDACYMSMIEICSQIKDHVEYFVGSQDVEPQTGYDYGPLLACFTTNYAEQFFKPHEFARHAVSCFVNTHKNTTRPVTHSALDLRYAEAVENNIREFAHRCSECMNLKSGFFEVIKEIRNTRNITFSDPDYIDLYTFYQAFVSIVKPTLNTHSHRRKMLVTIAEEGLLLLRKLIIYNMTGAKSRGAQGLSIYFPQYTIHDSYYNTIFDNITEWSNFLKNYWYHYFVKTNPQKPDTAQPLSGTRTS